MFSINLSALIKGVFIFLEVVLGGGILILLGYLVYYFMQYKYSIIIFEKDLNTNTYLIRKRRIKPIKDKVSKIIIAYKDMKKVKYKPEALTRFFTERGVSFVCIKIGNVIQPLRIKENDKLNVYLEMLDSDIIQAAAQQLEEGYKKYKKSSMLEKYAPYVLFIVVVVFALILFMNAFGKLDSVAKTIAEAITVGKQYLAQNTAKLQNVIPS